VYRVCETNTQADKKSSDKTENELKVIKGFSAVLDCFFRAGFEVCFAIGVRIIVELDRVRRVVSLSENLLLINGKFDEAFPFFVVFFSELENALLDFAISFDSSFVLPSLEKFKLEWSKLFLRHAGSQCLIPRSVYLQSGVRVLLLLALYFKSVLLSALAWKTCFASGVSLEDLFCFRR
jgi:hypothetical protein